MANTGFVWGAYAATQKGASDWTDDALADAATETSDAIDASGNASVIFSLEIAEDNTGAIDGDVTIYILRHTGSIYQDESIDPVFSITVTPVQNLTVSSVFSLNMQDYDNFKIAVENQSGQELSVSVKQKFSSIPVAS